MPQSTYMFQYGHGNIMSENQCRSINNTTKKQTLVANRCMYMSSVRTALPPLSLTVLYALPSHH